MSEPQLITPAGSPRRPFEILGLVVDLAVALKGAIDQQRADPDHTITLPELLAYGGTVISVLRQHKVSLEELDALLQNVGGVFLPRSSGRGEPPPPAGAAKPPGKP